jgi:KDO2-lipid IV(A) lauroyltransferase
MMQWFGYFSLQIAIQLVRFIPFGVLYALSDGMAFLLRRVFNYRKKVVYNNLKNAFPDKSEKEIQDIIVKTYKNLTDVTLETLKTYTMSLSDIEKRCVILNESLMHQYFEAGKSVIVGGAHFSNWEYSGLTMPVNLGRPLWIVYKPLTNKILDVFVNQKRMRTGSRLIAMDEVFSVMRKQKDDGPAAWIFLSDQSPSSRKSAHWVTFLNQDTACLPGIDVLARKFGYPVVYYHIRRIKRGFYELEYSHLVPDPTKAAEQEITQAFATFLENKIIETPENWLWSHKRWKIKR